MAFLECKRSLMDPEACLPEGAAVVQCAAAEVLHSSVPMISFCAYSQYDSHVFHLIGAKEQEGARGVRHVVLLDTRNLFGQVRRLASPPLDSIFESYRHCLEAEGGELAKCKREKAHLIQASELAK